VGKYLEANETTAVARQQLAKYNIGLILKNGVF
jgi:hypothetical protein